MLNLKNPGVSKLSGYSIATGNWIPHEDLDLGGHSGPIKKCSVAVDITLEPPLPLALIYNPPNDSPYRLSEGQFSPSKQKKATAH